ncbi:Hypp9030 [Branchiostoma lanceolatum]|uniref:Hypp9030 protein n=1 Tax=Branchiostoma lanceolatum TaxID=7740 RepID=A0A8J9ZAV0_BRALA|nr:Hypp9030 [Branchiostoma lanceolatum]
MALKLLTIAVAILVAATTNVVCQKSDVNNLRKLLVDHFSNNRHHVTNPAGKTAAAKFVSDTFRSYGLLTWEWPFQAENGYTGTNIFGMWPGRNTGRILDRPVCLTADLDTDKGRPGRDDNGSGMAALLEAARLITSQSCIQDHTIFFGVFDLEEKSGGSDGACAEGHCGSKEFSDAFIQTYLQFIKQDPDQWGGFITLDSILNYNSSAMAQTIPDEDTFKEAPGLTNVYQSVKANNQKGDFIFVAYRTNGDSKLHYLFDKAWAAEDNPQYKILSAGIPYKNITAIIDAKEGPYWQVYDNIVGHDVFSFWKENNDIPSIMLSDTGVIRQREKDWGAVEPADNMDLTQDRLQFLKKTTDVVTDMIRGMAVTRQECRDPMSEAPSGFNSGLSLSGELTLGQDDTRIYTFKVSSFTSSGIAKATLSNSSWSLDFEGRFDGDNHVLVLRPTPIDTAISPAPLVCNMEGSLEELSGGVLYTGRLYGGCGVNGDVIGDGTFVTFVLYNGDAGGSSVALPVILSLASGILVTALAAWFIVKRRRGYEGVQGPLLGNPTSTSGSYQT